MSLTKQLEAFVRVHIRPVTGPVQLWQGSIRPLADDPAYWDGWKPKAITSFGDVERALSVAPEVASFSFDVNAKYGAFWRALLADPNTQYLTGSDIQFLLASPEGRAAASAPRSSFRGQLEQPEMLPGGGFRIGAQSRIGTRYGPINLSGPVNKRTYNNVSNGGVFPDETFPRDSQGKKVRHLWGEKSDAGTTNDNDEDVARGMLTCVDCGMFFQGATSGEAPTSPTYLPDPPAPIVTPVGPGGTHTWTFAASVRTGNGHTRLGATTTVDDLPGDGNWTGVSDAANATPVNGAVITLTPYSSTLMAEVTVTGGGADLWVKKGAADSTNRWNKVDAAGQMFNSVSNEYFNGPAGYQGNGDDHFHKGGTPPSTNTAQITPGEAGVEAQSIFYRFWGVLGHMGKLTTVYGSNLAQEPSYAAISAGEIGTDYTSGKNFLFGADGNGVTLVINGETHFGFYAKGAKDEAAATGPFPFRVNACGWHVDNDVDEPIIDQAALAYQDVFTQMGGNDGLGYRTGARLTIPLFASAPTDPVLKSTTFFAVQDVTKDFLLDDKGYVTCICLDDDYDPDWGTFITDVNSEYFWETGETNQGQYMLSIMDDTLDATAGDVFRQFQHILRLDRPGAVNDSSIVNIWEYEFDLADGKYRSGVQEVRNEISIQMYGPRRLPSPLQLKFTRDPKTAKDAVSRRMVDQSVGPIYPAVTLKQRKAMQLELGMQIQLVHDDLPTESVPFYIQRFRHSSRTGTVYLEGRDRRGTYAAVVGDASTPVWASATPAQRQFFFYVSDSDGLMPDGTPGSKVR